MKNLIKQWFHKPTPLEAAVIELVTAEHAKLRAQTQAEWFASDVLFNTQRIQRLRNYIQGETK